MGAFYDALMAQSVKNHEDAIAVDNMISAVRRHEERGRYPMWPQADVLLLVNEIDRLRRMGGGDAT